MHARTLTPPSLSLHACSAGRCAVQRHAAHAGTFQWHRVVWERKVNTPLFLLFPFVCFNSTCRRSSARASARGAPPASARLDGQVRTSRSPGQYLHCAFPSRSRLFPSPLLHSPRPALRAFVRVRRVAVVGTDRKDKELIMLNAGDFSMIVSTKDARVKFTLFSSADPGRSKYTLQLHEMFQVNNTADILNRVNISARVKFDDKDKKNLAYTWEVPFLTLHSDVRLFNVFFVPFSSLGQAFRCLATPEEYMQHRLVRAKPNASLSCMSVRLSVCRSVCLRFRSRRTCTTAPPRWSR